MGVPFFYRQLVTKYVNCIIQNNDFLKKDKVSLFFDFNGLIHPVSHDIISIFEKGNISYDELEKKIIEGIIKYTDTIIKYINPFFVYIAIDGVPPRAKMVTQRLRRFKSAFENEKKEVKSKFNSNCISPGTDFMQKLSYYLQDYIKTLGIKVVLSDSSEVGEAEHNIIHYIKDNYKDDAQYIIYGLDADLIFLSLATTYDNIFLLREKQHFEMDNKKSESKDEIDILHFLSIGELKKAIHTEYQEKFDINIDNINRVISDLVFVYFLLGNDFLPHLKIINIYKNGIDILEQEYFNIFYHAEDYLINPFNKTVNMIFLRRMLNNINRMENDLILQNNKSKDFDPIQYHHKNWRNRYYKYFFKTNDNKYIEDICKNYWDTIMWVMNYYFDKCPSWRFYYKYPNAPTFSDLVNYINYNDLNNVIFESDVPYTKNQMLMMVLPSSSYRLLPEQYRNYMFNELLEYYPIQFRLEIVDKHAPWQFTPILPDINEKLILKYIN